VIPAHVWPGGGGGSSFVINPTTAENLSLVASAVGVISSALASLPCYVYRKTGDGREIDESHPLQRLIEQGPNEHQTWPDWVEWSAAQVLLRGNALSEVVRDSDGTVAAMEPLPWEGVSVIKLATSRLAYDAIRLSDIWGTVGAPRRLLEGEVLHLRDRSDDGLVGRSRPSRSPAVVDTAMTLQNTVRWSYANHASPGGTLTAPAHIEPDTVERLKTEWENKFGGSNVGRIAVLGDGLKYEAMGFSAEDTELLASRRFSAEEVARLFNLPPPLVGIWDNSTFTNSETAGRWFGMFCLAPWCRKIEAEFKRSLFSADEQATHHIEIDLSAMTRGDYTARWQAHKIAVEADILTKNEVREIEGFNPRRMATRATMSPRRRRHEARKSLAAKGA
jgi:HK97 family phage portal protein